MRRSIERSSQVFEKVFSTDALQGLRGHHGLESMFPDVRKRLAAAHSAQLGARRACLARVVSLLDRVIELLET